ncbi:MAG: response regulator [Helicobacteraceae bacterium]|nr:response regulator [Helicobacteraceae bacterium]
MLKKIYKILVVEDEWLNAEFVSDQLKELEHEVVGMFNSAPEVIDFCAKNSVDLIFMDINIEGSMDGIALANELNRDSVMPIIYMSAFGDSETIKEASESNIYGFINKPFSKRDIEAVLNVAMAKLKKEALLSKQHININSDELKLNSEYIYNFKNKTITYKKSVLLLSKNESKLLYIFCINIEKPLNYQQLQSFVWEAKEVSNSTIRDTILRLRKRLPFLKIETAVGIGYILKKA